MFLFHRPHNRFSHVRGRTCWIVLSLLLVGCNGGSSSPPPVSVATAGTPGAESAVRERLFVETRFAQAFKVYLDSGGKLNDTLPASDPVMDLSETTRPGVGLPGPFVELTMNCRACHLVDEHVGTPGGGCEPMPISLNGVSYQTVATTGEPPPETLHLRSMHRSIDRFDATGQLDPTFGTNGIARLDLSTGAVSGTAFRGDTS